MNTIEKLFSGQSTPISNHPLPFSLALLSPSPAEMPIALKLAPVFPRGSFYLLHPCCAPDLLNLYQNIMPWDLIRWVVRYLDNLIHLSICFVFFFFMAASTVHERSPARDWIWEAASTYTAATATPDPYNPQCRDGDWTHASSAATQATLQ